METLIDYIPLVLILCFGIFVQSAAGFAAGLLIVPSLLYIGYPLPEAQASMLVATIPQNIWGVWSLRDTLTPRKVAGPGIGRILFLPLGVFALQHLELLSPVTLRQIVGGFVLAATTATIYLRPTPREHLHPGWSFLAFPLSGFLQGLVGMGGPPMVFWVQSHDWSTRQTRAFLFSMYLVSIIPALGILFYFFGERVIKPGMISALTIPLLLLSTYLGLELGNRLGRHRLRRLTFGLLLMMGLMGLMSPWMPGN
tara:strand:- start:38309 stop:39070 length:762 start_codon:yes stop_codon:yes gene_type:complete